MALCNVDINIKPEVDRELELIANYVLQKPQFSELAYTTARHDLMDSLGCAILALQQAACRKVLGPIIQGTEVPGGSRIPGTAYVLDPILAAFNIGTMVRWLDFNDTWLAAEFAHPSDNLGAILALSDYLNQQGVALTLKDVLTAMIQAHEIQGVLALENGFNRLGYDHVLLVKIASVAVSGRLLQFTKQQIMDALSQAWIDGAALRTYRHAPNTGTRKSWAAGDATSRAVRLAWLIKQGEMGYPSALSAKKWGFYDSVLGGQALKIGRPFKDYVMENILFKISYPVEFHAQTAVECAVKLHPEAINKLDQIDKIVLTTQRPAISIISKTGPLHNPADRDHCLQYAVAIGLLYGDLKVEHYEETAAKDPRIDQLREKMQVEEDPRFTAEYLAADKRSIANAMQIFYKDGSKTEKIIIEYPIGHRFRRSEGIPLLFKKFEQSISAHYPKEKVQQFVALFKDEKQLETMPVKTFMEMWVKNS
jgi:2-methylcitrate dehydratase